MFYAESKDTVTRKPIVVEIRNDNVFTHCPKCDTKTNVDLADFVGDEDFELYGTGVFCDDCAKNLKNKHGEQDNVPITLDGVMLLNNVLSKAGYSEQLALIYDEFDICTVDDLEPYQYEKFADALTEMATCGLAGENDSKEDPFAFVPKEARGCMTNAELNAALCDMHLEPAMEKAVREVCKNGFVYAPELKGEKGR